MAGTWLFGASWWKFIKVLLLYGIVHVSLFFLAGGTEIVNAQGSDKNWYWLDGISTPTQSHIKSNHYKSSERFQIDALKIIYIKSFIIRNSFLSNAAIHMFLYSFIECLQVNRMCITSFGFYRKLVMKAK